MIFSLDYDNTITLAPKLWECFIIAAQSIGHTCIITTGRHASDPIKFFGLPVVYAGDSLKRHAAERAGYDVDVWIDDEPGTIEPCRKLKW